MRISRLHEIRLLYTRELRTALRERNIVINSLILPLVLYPAMLWLVATGITFVAGQSENATSRVVFRVVPPEHAAFEAFIASQDDIGIGAPEDPEAALAAGSIDLIVSFLDPPDGGPTPTVELLYDGSRENSNSARNRIESYLNDYRQRFLVDIASESAISAAGIQQVWIETRNLASGREMGGFILGLLVPIFMVVMLAVGGMYPAIDCTAGEREHGTWETLMTASASRGSILISKYLYVATMSLAAGLLNLIGMSMSLGSFLRPLMGDALANVDLAIPLGAIPVILAGSALLALFVAAGMMILASFARTFKEGQSLVAPFYIAVFLPLMFLQAPDIQFTPSLAMIPIVNVALMFREALSATYHWPQIAITIAVAMVMIGLALALAQRILRYEDILIGGYPGGLPRFLKHQLGWRTTT